MKMLARSGRLERVVIVGAGFAGLKLARKLSSKHFEVVLIDKNNYHQFQPLLYQVATCGLEPGSISFPLRHIFHRQNHLSIRIAEVLSIAPESRTVHTTIGDVRYDHLVLAHGAVTNWFNNHAIQQKGFALKSVEDALLLRNVLLQNLEQALIAKVAAHRSALLNVVIVGGGPTGVEMAGAIAEMKRKVLPKDYPELDFGQMHIYLLDAAPRLLNGMSKGSGITAIEYLSWLGVKVVTGISVKAYYGDTVVLSNGDAILSRCLIWTAGVKANAIPGLPAHLLSANGRIRVDQYSRVEGMPGMYAIGDIALMVDDAYPKGHPQVAPVAIQQAALLAKNLKRIIVEKPLTPFVYKDKGTMATVGRNLALAEIGKVKLSGFVAWFVWMAVHLMSIVGVKNRILIFINWAWQYFSYDHSYRLIIRPPLLKNRERSTHEKTSSSVFRRHAIARM